MIAALEVAGGRFTIEYELAPQMVVCSHGFGVGRDDRGLLSDIASKLPKDFGYVLFDYNDTEVESGNLRITPFSGQLQRLQAVLDWTRDQAQVERINIVAHSQGSIVVANLAPENIDNMILLAPPTSATNVLRKKNWQGKPGAKEGNGVWSIPRGDGSTSLMANAVFEELEEIDFDGELIKLSLFRPYTLIVAEADDILPDADYTELITMADINSIGIEGADHQFSGPARQQLVAAINQELLETPKA